MHEEIKIRRHPKNGRTEPWLQVTCTENTMKFGYVVLDYAHVKYMFYFPVPPVAFMCIVAVASTEQMCWKVAIF